MSFFLAARGPSPKSCSPSTAHSAHRTLSHSRGILRHVCLRRPAARADRVAAASDSNGTQSSFRTVGDIMTCGDLVAATPATTVEEALVLLVQNKITGLPVVDEDKVVVGVVSDYDLLALDALLEEDEADSGSLFPTADAEWDAFKEIKALITKRSANTVLDVMTEDPITCTADMTITAVARELFQKKVRRMPVIDGEGKLVGIITRGNIVKAALAARQA